MEQAPSLYTKGRVLVLLSGVVMSLGAPLIRLLESADAWQFLTYRSIAVVVMLSLLLVWRYRLNVLSAFARAGSSAVLAGGFLSVAFVAIVFAFLSTTIANALFLLSTAPIWTAVLAWFLLNEKPSGTTWTAIAIAIVGAAVMVAEGVAAGDVFGDVMALAAAAGFACFSVVIRRGRQTDMLPSVFYAGLMSGTLAAVGGLTLDIGLAPSYWDIGVSFAYGAIGISGGLVLYTLGSRYVPAAELNVLSLGEVVLAPLWVWLAYSETPTGFTLAGGLIILVAVVVQARGAWQPTDEFP